MPPPLFPLLSLSQNDSTVKQLCRGAFIYPASFSLAGNRQLLTHAQTPEYLSLHLFLSYIHTGLEQTYMQDIYMTSCSPLSQWCSVCAINLRFKQKSQTNQHNNSTTCDQYTWYDMGQGTDIRITSNKDSSSIHTWFILNIWVLNDTTEGGSERQEAIVAPICETFIAHRGINHLCDDCDCDGITQICFLLLDDVCWNGH